jgi:ATP-dependent RNA helicase MSS116, mitochondrial
LVLSQDERFFIKDSVSTLPIRPLSASCIPPAPTSETVHQAHTELQPILAAVSDEEKAQVYRAWMGYHNTFLRRLGWTKEQLVREAGQLAVSSWGWTESKPPQMDPKTIGKMGLKGVNGLNVVRKAVVPKVPSDGGDGQVGTSNKVHIEAAAT